MLNKEICRLNVRRSEGQSFDNYLVFTNRKLTGKAHTSIKNHLRKELCIVNADVIGLEDITRLVGEKPELIDRYGLLRNMLPDRFFESDIRDVIVLFSQNSDWMNAEPLAEDCPLDYLDKEQKNVLNQVSDYYFNEIKSHSLKYFGMIEFFLKDPRNREFMLKYENTTSDIRGFIQKNIGSHSFIDLLETISDRIAGTDPQADVHRVRKLVRVFVHFMYWNCDIGQKA